MKTRILFSLSVVGLIVLSGCFSSTKQKGTTSTQLINGIWMLESLNGYPMENDSFDKEKPRLEIKTKDGMYFGYSGCNNLSGQLVLTESTIEFRPGPLTRKACINGNIESDFLTALVRAKKYSIKKGKLSLLDQSAKTVCLFRKIH
jgi:heat shock protein HslJ